MKTRTIKGLVAAVAVLIGGFVQAEDDGCGSCTAKKVIEKAHEQGISEVRSLSYSLGNWKVEGVNNQNVEVNAKIHCPQCKDSTASVIRVGKASRVSITEIVQKVKEQSAKGKIQKVQYNGYNWVAVVFEDTVELEFHFDKDGGT